MAVIASDTDQRAAVTGLSLPTTSAHWRKNSAPHHRRVDRPTSDLGALLASPVQSDTGDLLINLGYVFPAQLAAPGSIVYHDAIDGKHHLAAPCSLGRASADYQTSHLLFGQSWKMYGVVTCTNNKIAANGGFASRFRTTARSINPKCRRHGISGRGAAAIREGGKSAATRVVR